ncbi:MAG TPA: DUF4436 family protein [Pyrinomonadaceae bacterium]
MSITGRKSIENFCVSLGIIIVFVIASVLTAAAQSENSNPSTKGADFIEVVAKVLSIEPIKGDVSVRLEFEPNGSYVKEDGTLARNVKFDINSSNGKQEISFEKGKRMTPTEAILNMYDGSVTDYPFDKHKAELIFWFTTKPDKPADKPKTTGENPAAEPKPETKTESTIEETEAEVPFTLDFTPTLAGYTIETAKSKDSDESYVDVEMTVARSSMVKFFAVFVMIVMWAVSLAVLFLTLSIVVRGRKVEIAMFSFIATLIFSFVAVRNTQPAVPPIGTFSDYSSFFWAEVILALSLLTIIFTWLLRPAAK